jgi:predicted phage-related endonuclease
MIHYDIQQNSEDWYKLRCGKFTASMFGSLFSKTNTISYRDSINNVVHQIVTGEIEKTYINSNMERGHDWEDMAAISYEMSTLSSVLNGGFWEYNDYVGASPDRLVDDDGILEIKTHKGSIMVDVLYQGKSPLLDMYQVQGQLLCTGRKWCDFMAYNPNYKPLIIRIERDEELIKKIVEKLQESILIVKEKIKYIK